MRVRIIKSLPHRLPRGLMEQCVKPTSLVVCSQRIWWLFPSDCSYLCITPSPSQPHPSLKLSPITPSRTFSSDCIWVHTGDLVFKHTTYSPLLFDMLSLSPKQDQKLLKDKLLDHASSPSPLLIRTWVELCPQHHLLVDWWLFHSKSPPGTAMATGTSTSLDIQSHSQCWLPLQKREMKYLNSQRA